MLHFLQEMFNPKLLPNPECTSQSGINVSICYLSIRCGSGRRRWRAFWGVGTGILRLTADKSSRMKLRAGCRHNCKDGQTRTFGRQLRTSGRQLRRGRPAAGGRACCRQLQTGGRQPRTCGETATRAGSYGQASVCNCGRVSDSC